MQDSETGFLQTQDLTLGMTMYSIDFMSIILMGTFSDRDASRRG